jgi:predicted metal-dependent hydrolase
VPGLDPHPQKHPRGHRALAPSAADRWRYGLDLFDHGYLWEAHEVLEHSWRALPPRSPERDLAQAIILAAAALLRSHMGDDRSAATLCARAVALLVRVSPATARAHGVDAARLAGDLERALRGGPWPRLIS